MCVCVCVCVCVEREGAHDQCSLIGGTSQIHLPAPPVSFFLAAKQS